MSISLASADIVGCTTTLMTFLIGVDWDHRTRTNGVYRIAGPTHQGWSKFVDKELGNYDYLLGIDVSSTCILTAHTNPSQDRS